MNQKEMVKEKYKAQLDEWKADIAKLKAQASQASKELQVEMNKQVKDLDRRIESAGAKLAELAEASEEAWDSVKKGVDSAWDSLKSTVHDATSRFKDEIDRRRNS